MMRTDCWWKGPAYSFGGLLGMIVCLVFWALVIYGIFYLISNLTKRSSEGDRKEESPMEILKRRYAKGEIDTEEFTKRKKELES